MVTAFQRNLVLGTLLTLVACVSPDGGPGFESAFMHSEKRNPGSANMSAGALQLESRPPIGGTFQSPCLPEERFAGPPMRPQVEVGFAAPYDGRDALFGDSVWYAGYRCR